MKFTSEVQTKRQEIDTLKAQMADLTARVEKLEAARVASAKEAQKDKKKAK